MSKWEGSAALRYCLGLMLPMRDTERNSSMIELTRLNGSRLSLNCDLIKYVDSAPDTLLTLVTGEKLVVLEVRAEVTRKIVEYRAAVIRQAWPDADAALSARVVRSTLDLIAETEKLTD